MSTFGMMGREAAGRCSRCRLVLAVAASAAVTVFSAAAAAATPIPCAPPACLPASFLPRGGDVPHNLPAVAVVPPRPRDATANATALGAAVLRVVEEQADGAVGRVVWEEALAAHLLLVNNKFATVSGAASGPLNAEHPDDGLPLVAIVRLPSGLLQSGRTYALEVTDLCATAAATTHGTPPPPPARVTFRAIHWVALPEGLGRLTLGDVQHAPLMLPEPFLESDGSCTMPPDAPRPCSQAVPSVFASATVAFHSLSSSWAAALWLRPYANGRPWVYRSSAAAPPDIFGSFSTFFFRPCLPDDPAAPETARGSSSSSSLPPACAAAHHAATTAMGAPSVLQEHVVEWRAWLPGTATMLHSAVHRLPLSCSV